MGLGINIDMDYYQTVSFREVALNVNAKVAPNPGGKSSHALTWQTYQNRSGYIVETKDYEEIRTLARDEKLLSKKCSTLDALIVKDIDQSFDDYKARQGFLERALGKQVTRIGGENPGEPIKVSATNGLALEGLDSETLLALRDLIRAAKEKQSALAAPMTIEGESRVVDSIEKSSE